MHTETNIKKLRFAKSKTQTLTLSLRCGAGIATLLERRRARGDLALCTGDELGARLGRHVSEHRLELRQLEVPVRVGVGLGVRVRVRGRGRGSLRCLFACMLGGE